MYKKRPLSNALKNKLFQQSPFEPLYTETFKTFINHSNCVVIACLWFGRKEFDQEDLRWNMYDNVQQQKKYEHPFMDAKHLQS